MRRGTAIAGLAVSAVLALPSWASADAIVNAEGNPLLGGLAFDPGNVEVAVGETVFWTNTDFLVPHTATEDHELWDLGGDYGATPLNPAGFGPGDTVSRAFDAGTFDYYCRVHGQVQSGVVAVQPKIGHLPRRSPTRLVVRWGVGKLPEGQVFDVQQRLGKGRWRTVADGTSKSSGRFPLPRVGGKASFRVRVRNADDASVSSGWSPPVSSETGSAQTA